jgi:hypothetical protein
LVQNWQENFLTQPETTNFFSQHHKFDFTLEAWVNAKCKLSLRLNAWSVRIDSYSYSLGLFSLGSFFKQQTKQKLIGHMQNHARRFYMIRVNHAMMARYKAKANKIRLKKDLLSSHRNYLHRNLYMPF